MAYILPNKPDGSAWMYPNLTAVIGGDYERAAKANAWPAWLGGPDIYPAFALLADEASGPGTSPGQWLAALVSLLMSDPKGEGEPAPGFYQFTAALALLAEDSLLRGAADRSAADWGASLAKAKNEALVKVAAAGEPIKSAGDAITGLAKSVQENPRTALALGAAVVGLGLYLWTMGPAALLRLVRR